MSELFEVHRWNEIAGNGLGDTSLEPVYADLIREEFKEWLEAEDEAEELDSLADLCIVITGRLHAKGIMAEDALRIVNQSNFSKFDTSVEDAEESVALYADDSRYENVRYEQVGMHYVIRGDKVDGTPNKILKSHKFIEPDFSPLLEDK